MYRFSILMFFCCLSMQCLIAQPNKLNNYNVVWTTPSKNSSESMPCGGGDIGLNAWVENGDVLFYLSRSGTFDENNQFLKMGRVRLHFSSNPFNNKARFHQELKLKEGLVQILGKDIEVIFWVDVFRPIIHININSKQKINVTAVYENWRYADRIITGTELQANSYKIPQPFNIITYRDSVAVENNQLIFFHRNKNDVTNIFDYTVKAEGMDAVKNQMYNPIANNTFGGIITASNFSFYKKDSGVYAGTKYHSWQFKTSSKIKRQQIDIALHVNQSATIGVWKTELNNIMNDGILHQKTAFLQTQNWWQQFWDRSYIMINGADSFVSRNYTLFRYMLACNAYGKWPTKFNGGLFTFDPVFVGEKYGAASPDFRLWGGGTMTAQNQRLVYFPFLKSGDIDMMQSQLDTYLRMQHNAELRSKVYWNHDGACFTEQLENFGLPNIFEYGYKRPAGFDKGVEYNAWLEYTWETVFEFCFMMLETERYQSGDITRYISFIESCLTFYDRHYQYLAQKNSIKTFNDKGEYIFYPSSAAETYKDAYNSVTVIAALQTVLNRLLELPEKYLSNEQRQKWTAMLKRIPPLPKQQINGKTVLAPAQAWSRIQNVEVPQLYPVFPWGIYGVGKSDLETAINTYQLDSQVVKTRSAIGWKQHNIFAAKLGLTDDAVALTKEKFANGKYRFPAFWGPGFDWTPDHNQGGSAMVGLQEMLLQTDGKKIYLFPAWPKEWNVHFKLHAPYNTTIEAELKDGKIKELIVNPENRKNDIEIFQPKQ